MQHWSGRLLWDQRFQPVRRTSRKPQRHRQTARSCQLRAVTRDLRTVKRDLATVKRAFQRAKAHDHAVEVTSATNGTGVPAFSEATAMAECPEGSQLVGVGIERQTGNLRPVSWSLIPEPRAATVRMETATGAFAVFRLIASCAKVRTAG